MISLQSPFQMLTNMQQIPKPKHKIGDVVVYRDVEFIRQVIIDTATFETQWVYEASYDRRQRAEWKIYPIKEKNIIMNLTQE